MNSPRIRLSEYDEEVYEAEEMWLDYLSDQDLRLDAEEVGPFISECLRSAGLETDELPRVLFDVGVGEFSAWHSGADGSLHFDIRVVSRDKVIHELAHWLRPRDGHGAQWAGTLLGLAKAAFGDDAAAQLRAEFDFAGIDADEGWA